MRCSRRVERVLRNGKAVATVRGARASSQGRGGKVLYAQGPTDRAPNGGPCYCRTIRRRSHLHPIRGPNFHTLRVPSPGARFVVVGGGVSPLVVVATLILISRDLC